MCQYMALGVRSFDRHAVNVLSTVFVKKESH